MGLLVTEDGHYQGWLAALLCCCAAVNEDEHPLEMAKTRCELVRFLVLISTY